MAADLHRSRAWMHLGSIRARTTATAVFVGGVALVAAAFLLVALLERGLVRNLEEAILLRAQILASTLEYGTEPAALSIPAQDDLLVQIVDEEGRVVRAGPGLGERGPMIPTGSAAERLEGTFTIEGDPFLAAGTRADTPDGVLTVLVGRSLASVEETTEVARDLLAVAVPVLLIVVACTTWLIVGRALAPVESIRREVAGISAAELHRRVPAPPGDDEITRLAHTMNDMLTRLEGSRRRQERLVADASHELRNPIAAIRQSAEVALAHPDKTTVADLADDVLREDMRLQQLVEDLLLLARADEHTLDLAATPVDLDDIVLEEADRLRKMTDLEIDTSGVSAAGSMGDRRALQRAVQNLADNAVRHARSKVGFTVSGSEREVVVLVEDDGAGIPPEHREAVFERFTRLDDARDRGRGGAGLGLAIVSEIVAAHGGSASVDGSSLGGAAFRIVLPRAIH